MMRRVGLTALLVAAVAACADDGGGDEEPISGVPQVEGIERSFVTQIAALEWNRSGAAFGSPTPCELAVDHVGGGAGYFRITRLSLVEETWEIDGFSGAGRAVYVEATPEGAVTGTSPDEPLWLRLDDVERSDNALVTGPVELVTGRPQVLVFSAPDPRNAGFPTVIDEGVLTRAGDSVVTTTGSFSGHRYELPIDDFVALLEATWLAIGDEGDAGLCPEEARVEPTSLE